MSANRVLVGAAVGGLLLALGALEVVSQRVRVDPPSTVASDVAEAPTEAVYLVDAEDRAER